MNYALYVLTGYLKGEKRAYRDAKKWLKENSFLKTVSVTHKGVVKNFNISKKLAEKRIPELTEAISQITRMEQLKKHS